MRKVHMAVSDRSAYYTRGEAAAIGNVHPRTIWREIRRGRLKATRVGARYRIAPEDLQRYLDGLPPEQV